MSLAVGSPHSLLIAHARVMMFGPKIRQKLSAINGEEQRLVTNELVEVEN